MFYNLNVPKLIPDVRTADNRNIPVSSNFLTFDDRQLPSCRQRYKITYLYVFSFKMFRSELFWCLFALTFITISVSGDGSTVWRHATEWRRDFRAFPTMTSWFSCRFYYSFSSWKRLILFLLCGYLSKVKTFADCLNVPCEVYRGLILEYSLSHVSRFMEWNIAVS